MSPFLAKILIAQRHQLIRWAKPSGYIAIVCGLLMIFGGAAAIPWMRSKARSVKPSPAELEEFWEIREEVWKTIQTTSDIEQLRSLASKLSRQKNEWEDRNLKAFDTIVLGGQGFMYFTILFGLTLSGYGGTLIRARQLALEANASEMKAGPESTVVSTEL